MNRSIHPQAERLEDLIRAAAAGRHAADNGLLFASREGLMLVNAAFGLFECDGLYDLAEDVRGQIGFDGEGFALGQDGERVVMGPDPGPGRAAA